MHKSVPSFCGVLPVYCCTGSDQTVASYTVCLRREESVSSDLCLECQFCDFLQLVKWR